jgi:membrane protein YdbS with pleckstrin-like domain
MERKDGGSLNSLLAIVGTTVILTFVCILIYMSWASQLGLPQISVYAAMAIYILAVVFSVVVWVYRVIHKEKSQFQGLP